MSKIAKKTMFEVVKNLSQEDNNVINDYIDKKIDKAKLDIIKKIKNGAINFKTLGILLDYLEKELKGEEKDE